VKHHKNKIKHHIIRVYSSHEQSRRVSMLAQRILIRRHRKRKQWTRKYTNTI